MQNTIIKKEGRIISNVIQCNSIIQVMAGTHVIQELKSLELWLIIVQCCGSDASKMHL